MGYGATLRHVMTRIARIGDGKELQTTILMDMETGIVGQRHGGMGIGFQRCTDGFQEMSDRQGRPYVRRIYVTSISSSWKEKRKKE